MPLQDIEASDPDWYLKVNQNFTDIVDLPFPIVVYVDLAAINAAKNPKKYKHCFALVGDLIYTSDGTSWVVYREQLTLIADLDTGTATIEDVKNAYNSLLADLRAKDWILV